MTYPPDRDDLAGRAPVLLQEASDDSSALAQSFRGARVPLHVAAALGDDVAGAAGIHPGALVSDRPDSPHDDVAKMRGELYFAFAENDRTATPQNIEQFRQELESHRVRGAVERLSGTTQGFAMADLPVYDRQAAQRHFERTLDLWRRHLRAG